MGNEWRNLPFSEAVLINPTVRLERGAVYPFVDMAAVNSDSRNANGAEKREFKGSGSRFQDGDTLMARITPCLENGKIARYQAVGDKPEGHGSTEFIVIRGRPNVTDNDFAYYLTQWGEVRNYAVGQMTGTSGRQRVPVDSLDYLTVPLPPLPEQRAIAHILGTLDDKIELNRRLNQTLEAMARAIFQDWFVDFGPVRAKLAGQEPYLPPELWALFPDRLAATELGEAPEGWGVKALGEIAEISSGKRPGNRYPDASDEACVPLWGGNGPMAFVREPLIDYPIILTGRVGTLGSVFRITSPCWPSDNTLIIKPNCQQTFEYLLFQLKRINFDVLNRGSTQPLLTQGDLKSQCVLIPSEDCLSIFHKHTTSLYNQYDEKELESLTLTALRDTLLPRLVSGEIKA